MGKCIKCDKTTDNCCSKCKLNYCSSECWLSHSNMCDELATQIECCICFDSYSSTINSNVPIILSCGHTVCKKCSEKITCCPYDKKTVTIISPNYSLIASLPVPNCSITSKSSLDFPPFNHVLTAKELLAKLTAICETTNYSHWCAAMIHHTKTSYHQLWTNLMKFLITKIIYDDINIPMKMSPTFEIDSAWHNMLLIPKLAHEVHCILGNIVEHCPINFDPEKTEDRQQLFYDNYKLIFLKDHPDSPQSQQQDITLIIRSFTRNDQYISVSSSFLKDSYVSELYLLVQQKFSCYDSFNI